MSKPTSKPDVVTARLLRILYAEDSPQDVELSLRDLKKAGYEPIAEVVSDPQDFRDKLRAQSFDVILSDYNLRSWTGMDALEMVRQEAPDTPFILVTGTLGEEAAVDCIKKGVTDYVIKDHPARLSPAVVRALDEKRLRAEKGRAEHDIRRAKEQWERTFDTVRDAILVLNADCKVTQANRAAAQLAGLESRPTCRQALLRGHTRHRRAASGLPAPGADPYGPGGECGPL